MNIAHTTQTHHLSLALGSNSVVIRNDEIKVTNQVGRVKSRDPPSATPLVMSG